MNKSPGIGEMLDEFRQCLFAEISEPSNCLEMGIQFSERAKGDSHVMSVTSSRTIGLPLSDVRGHRDRGSAHLRGQLKSLRRRKSRGNSVDA